MPGRDAQHRPSRQLHAAFGGLAALVLALLPCLWLWHFTVDDALITARVAHHIAIGAGYRFNPGGPPVDAVTPLGLPYLLAPFAAGGPLAALGAAKLLGLAAWLGTAACVGAQIARRGRKWRRFLPLPVLAVCVPLAAWAVAGMETPVIAGLATLAIGAGRFTPGLAGLCAAFRPEMIPWAATLACGMALVRHRRVEGVLTALLLSAALPLLVAGLRYWLFGSPAPLSAFAKPPDPGLGVRYVIGGLLLTGPPWLVLAPRRWSRLPPPYRVVLVASVAHFGALALAGGDWMAFFRLFTPVLPSLLLVAAAIAEASPSWANAGRLVAALASSLLLLVWRGPDARQVGKHRADLVRQVAPALRDSQVVAALDIGWVGASTDARVLDLAGVTDPQIAALPGGHTSKRIPRGLLAARGADTLVLLLAPGERLQKPWFQSRFTFAVEQRVAHDFSDRDFRVFGTYPLGGTQQTYVVLKAFESNSK